MESTSKQRLTPKDFVLYLATMIALYTSVFALVALLFEYVNILHPDALNYYTDPYSSGIRFSIASLIVIFPVYVYLTRLLNQDVRENPEKRDLGFRRWLMYLTILAAGVGIVGDLIALLNTFLGGEVTTRFVLKVVIVLVIAGAVFTYYMLDLKDYWRKHEQNSKIAGGVAILFVLATIVGGFMIMGSPSSQRLIRFDQQKTSDLQTIQWQIANYWQTKNKLPAPLTELNNTFIDFTVPVDPQTGEAYGYEIVPGQTPTFKLCATFNRPNNNPQSVPDYSAVPYGGFKGTTSWQHGEGNVCFERTIDPDMFPPINKNL